MEGVQLKLKTLMSEKQKSLSLLVIFKLCVELAFRCISPAMLLPSTSMHSCFCGLSPNSTSL